MNKQAGVLHNTFFPLQTTLALALEDSLDHAGVRLFFAQFHQGAGDVADPLECLLLDQVVSAHLLIGQLHAAAAAAEQIEVKKLYLNAALRLRAELCHAVLTLEAYRNGVRRRRPRRTDISRGPEAPKAGRYPRGDRDEGYAESPGEGGA
jgi:hypothetical protein